MVLFIAMYMFNYTKVGRTLGASVI